MMPDELCESWLHARIRSCVSGPIYASYVSVSVLCETLGGLVSEG